MYEIQVHPLVIPRSEATRDLAERKNDIINFRSLSSMVEYFIHIEEVEGSNPSATTTNYFTSWLNRSADKRRISLRGRLFFESSSWAFWSLSFI